MKRDEGCGGRRVSIAQRRAGHAEPLRLGTMLPVLASSALGFSPGVHKMGASGSRSAAPAMVIGQQADSFGPATLLRKLKSKVDAVQRGQQRRAVCEVHQNGLWDRGHSIR